MELSSDISKVQGPATSPAMPYGASTAAPAASEPAPTAVSPASPIANSVQSDTAKPAHMSDEAWRNYNSMENGKSYFDDAGKLWKTRYGGLVRITDASGKTLKWQDLDGRDMQPESVKTMQRIGDDADDMWNRLAYNTMNQERRQNLRNSRDGYLADAISQGVGVLVRGGGEVKELNGKRYRAVIYDGDDKTAIDNPVKNLNALKEQMGSRGRLGKMGLYIEIGADNKPVGGAQPRVILSTRDEAGGKHGEEIDIGTAMGQWVKKYMADTPNADEGSARRRAVELFGGNYAHWDMTPTEAQKYIDSSRMESAKIAAQKEKNAADYELAMKKLDAQQQQFAQSLDFEKRKALGDMYAKLNAGGRAVSPLDIFKSMSDEMKMSYFADEDGKPLDSQTMAEKFKELATIAQAMSGAGGVSVAQIDATINGIANGGAQPPAAPSAEQVASRRAQLKAELEKRNAQGGGSPATRPTSGEAILSQMREPAASPVKPASVTPPATPPVEPAEPTPVDEIENVRRMKNGKMSQKRRDFLSRYKTVQDVAIDVIKTMNKQGMDSVANPDGTRRELSPNEVANIVRAVRNKFNDAGMGDYWLKTVEEYGPQSYGARLTDAEILDKLLRNWNNTTSNIVYGNRRNKKTTDGEVIELDDGQYRKTF